MTRLMVANLLNAGQGDFGKGKYLGNPVAIKAWNGIFFLAGDTSLHNPCFY
jgi:hypothetical protein